MKIVDFISDFKAKKIVNSKINENAVHDYIVQTLEVKTYVPFADKRELCSQVIESSCNNKNGIITVDSVSRYILFTIAVLTKFTNLEFNSGDDLDSLDEYDLLCESGLLDEILSAIGQEYSKCNNLLNMMMQDVIDNNNTVEAVLAKFMEGLSDNIGNLVDTLSYKIDEMNIDLSQVDIEKFKPLLDKLGGLTE